MKDSRKAPLALLLLLALACSTGAADEPLVLIVGPARTALDSANALYKSRRYRHAMELYRSAARLAPQEPAPLLGMLMAANKLEDESLADSIQTVIRRQSSTSKTSAAKR